MKKTYFKLSVIICLIAFTGCVKDSQTDQPKTIEVSIYEITSQETFVSIDEAQNIGSKFTLSSKNESVTGKGGANPPKTVKNIREVKNRNDIAALYVINYDEGGFVLLSADKRIRPILAFSDENEFITDEGSYPLGLQFWIDDVKEQIAEIQNSNREQSEDLMLVWERVASELPAGIMAKEDPVTCYDHTDVVIKGPLISSTWSQQGGFNDQLPFITCSGNQFQVYAGCVPVAMAQIMKYHQFPTSYNWGGMPLSYGTNTTALFIEDIHDAIGTYYFNYPSYSCTATSVSASADMGAIFKLSFGYSSASFANFNSTTVKNNIAYNRPVILAGSNSSAGHMWVCDGTRTTTYYYANCSSNSYLDLHMNWGWGAGSYNGWFAFNNWNPGNTNYNNNKKMVYNIIP